MKRTLRALLDEVIIKLLQVRWLDRFVGYLAYQRRRMTRRRVESRLEENGNYPDEVVRGPFCGMRFPGKSDYIDCRFEKVFGAYEHELFDVLGSLSSTTPAFDEVVVIGAADGFYAVGLALILPDVRIQAFERDAFRSRMLEKVASVNDVRDRIHLHGDCSPDILSRVLRECRSLVVCDVDGYETELMDPERIPELLSATLLIETHDCFVPGVCGLLKERFSDSHLIREIHMSGPDFSDRPELVGLKMHEVEALVGSDRPMLQTWLQMWPKIA